MRVFEVQTLQRLGTPMGNVTSGPDYSNWVPSSFDRLKQCHNRFPRHRRVALMAKTRADADQALMRGERETEGEREKKKEREGERVQWSSAAPSLGTPILRSEDEKRSLHYHLETTPPPQPSSLPSHLAFPLSLSLSLPPSASSLTQKFVPAKRRPEICQSKPSTTTGCQYSEEERRL
ncbi:hypothetical protein E1301_Tti003462 [Triplophysa tibetana]|uniref:Uncharacterized protein n=1 Tax=Triplophysa tibetana TaxID=1572043 RepID=A0A5A9PT33_9TELE|nr:hypothetical protein E1301_Tti003462 [Triplophysa tibetana]